jgi:hypothetical protein
MSGTKVAVMQPYIFPYIGYFQLIHQVDTFVFLDDVNFINKGWINRNYIQQNGNKILFTIPLAKASQNAKINELAIASDTSWQKKLIKTIEQAYSKAPYYDQRIAMIKSIFSDYVTIAEMTKQSIQVVAQTLGLKTKFVWSSESMANDKTGSDRILQICKMESASTYINPSGGVDLYDKATFKAEEIDLYFIATEPHSYAQNAKEFVPYLSIIDVLMYNSNEEVLDLLNKCALV